MAALHIPFVPYVGPPLYTRRSDRFLRLASGTSGWSEPRERQTRVTEWRGGGEERAEHSTSVGSSSLRLGSRLSTFISSLYPSPLRSEGGTSEVNVENRDE